MTRNIRPRQALLTLLVLLLPVVAVACSGSYPNSTFSSHTEFNRDLTSLWNTMMGWGTFVFVLVEVILIWTMWRFRHRAGGPEPKQVHGNTAMEIAWTLAPAAILAVIAVPTVRYIWKYGTDIPANAVQIDVIGHQWWWEFRYPQYNITTANEIYLPTGRTVHFTIRTADVIHSFWIPQLGGKRDATWQHKTNDLWFTPDSTGVAAFNGSCNEFCGLSHANMKFRVFTVAPDDFERWAAHEGGPAVFPAAVPGVAATPVGSGSTGGAMAAVVSQQTPAPVPVEPTPAPFTFPRDQVPAHVVPATPTPAGLAIADEVLAAGDPQRGFQTYSRSACIGCHRVRGNPSSVGVIGPDLTHFGSRMTLGAGLFPNDARHVALWIKNARRMKPLNSTSMPTMGIGEVDPVLKNTITAALGGLTDQQIADITAYLLSLK